MLKSYIAIIEDDLVLNQAYRENFESEFELGFFLRGEDDVLISLAKRNPLVIILDLMIPGDYNGIELLEFIKKDNKISNIPVIVVSNLGQEGDIKKITSMGADEYIVKANTPISVIISEVKKFIAGKEK